jgi:hypothetical protein
VKPVHVLYSNYKVLVVIDQFFLSYPGFPINPEEQHRQGPCLEDWYLVVLSIYVLGGCSKFN